MADDPYIPVAGEAPAPLVDEPVRKRTVSELLGGRKGATVSDLLNKPARTLDGQVSILDYAPMYSGAKRIAHYFGENWLHEGKGQVLPGMSDENIKLMRDNGTWNDWSKGQMDINRTMLEVLMRPTAAALDIALRGGTAAYKTAQDLGVEGITSLGGSEKLAKDVVSIPDIFMGGKAVGVTGPRLNRPAARVEALDIIQKQATEERGLRQVLTEAELQRARDLGILNGAETAYVPRPQETVMRAEAEYAPYGPKREVELAPTEVVTGSDFVPTRSGVEDVRLAPLEVRAPKPVVPSVAERVSTQLQKTGAPREEADAYAAMIQARAEVRAERLGYESAEALFDERGFDIAGGRGTGPGTRNPLATGAGGRLDTRPGERNLITMMKSADASTFGHEAWHQFLYEMFEDSAHPRATPEMKRDLNLLLDWAGARGAKSFDEVAKKSHELVARGGEAYLREGRAPTKELQGVFDRFRQWLVRIYDSVRGLRVNINDEVRGIFDRLLAISPEKRVPGAADAAMRGESFGPLSTSKGPAVNKEPSLIEFLAARGGLAPNAEVGTIFGGKNRFVPGYGSLIRKDGMSLDRAREAAVEAGYLVDHGAEAGTVTTSFIDDLLVKLDAEARGTKQYREGTAPVEAPEVRAERLDHYDSEFAAHLDESGTPRETVTPEVREKVVGLMDREGLTADAAFERVLMEETDHAAQTGKVEPTGLGEEIPGWNVPDDAGAVPRPSGESAPVGARYGYPGEPVGSPVRPADIQTPRQDLGRSTVLVDKAGNIRLDLINSTEDINAYLRETALANDDFLTERRGRVPDNMIAPLAEMLGMDAKYLDKKKIGDAYNDREIYALFQGLLQAAADVKAKHEKFFSTKADEDFIAYQQAQEKLVMWQGKTSGATAEAGRALRVFQLLKNMEGMGEASSLAAKSAKFLAERELKAETGKTLFQMKQDALKAGPLQTPAEIAKFAADSHKPTWKDKFQEAWVNSLLSGIKTAGINVQGNFIPLVVGFPEKLVAGAVGAVDRAVTGSKGGVRIGEAKAELYSLYQGLQDGAIAFKEIIKNEQKAETALRDIERRNYGRESKLLEKEGIEAELNPTERHFRRSIGGTTGQVVRMPGRALAATDAAFKAVHHRKEISAQAYRIASEEVDAGKIKTQDGFVKRVNELERNPTEEMLNNAEKKATDDTYNSPLGNAGNALATLTQSSLPAKIIMPFVRTPVNLVKWAGRRTPLGLFAKSVRDDIMGKNGKVAQQMAIGRMTVGTTIAATSIGLALNGMITGGGPTDPGERENWLHDHQPYSIKIGGDWYSYGRLDPVATLLGTTADLVDNAHKIPDGEYEKAAMGLMTSVYKNIISKTYLSGVTSAAQAVSDPERYGGHWIQRLAGTAVPSFISQMNMMPVIGDPYLREVHGILDVYKSRIPGLRQTLQVRRDVFGEPIQPGETREDAVVSAMRDVNYFPAKMGKKIAGVETTPEEYDDLTRIAGRMAKEQLDHLVGSPNFDSIPSVKRAELMKQIVDHARKSARQLVAAQYPRIIKQAHDDRLADLEID